MRRAREGRVGPVDAGGEDDELVAAETADEMRAHRRLQPLCDRDQHAVARAMAVAVR